MSVPIFEWEFVSRSLADTDVLGQAVGESVEPGTVLALSGNLGAGKTRFTQAVATALGVPEQQVTSPTFVLIQEYAGRLPVFHFDTWRIKNPQEFLDLGADELMHADGVCLIEWANRVSELLPADHLAVSIELDDETTRRFRFAATGNRSALLLRQIREKLSVE